MVPPTLANGTPCFSATHKYMANSMAAVALIVNEVVTLSKERPSNKVFISSKLLRQTPTRPTSPNDMGSSGSKPIWVGKSRATLNPVCPCSLRYLYLWFESRGVPNPEYCLIVHKRSRYIPLWIPLV